MLVCKWQWKANQGLLKSKRERGRAAHPTVLFGQKRTSLGRVPSLASPLDTASVKQTAAGQGRAGQRQRQRQTRTLIHQPKTSSILLLGLPELPTCGPSISYCNSLFTYIPLIPRIYQIDRTSSVFSRIYQNTSNSPKMPFTCSDIIKVRNGS